MCFLICFSFHLPFADTVIFPTSLSGSRKKKYTLFLVTCLLWFPSPWVGHIAITHQGSALLCTTELNASIPLPSHRIHWAAALSQRIETFLRAPMKCSGKCTIARASLITATVILTSLTSFWTIFVKAKKLWIFITFSLIHSAFSDGRLKWPAGTDMLSEMDTLPVQVVSTQLMPSSKRWKCLEKTLMCFNQA